MTERNRNAERAGYPMSIRIELLERDADAADVARDEMRALANKFLYAGYGVMGMLIVNLIGMILLTR